MKAPGNDDNKNDIFEYLSKEKVFNNNFMTDRSEKVNNNTSKRNRNEKKIMF